MICFDLHGATRYKHLDGRLGKRKENTGRNKHFDV